MKKETIDEKLQRLIDDHLIGWWVNETPTFKGHYKVIPVNLIDFLKRYIVNKRF